MKTTNKDMEIRKLFDEGDSMHVISSKLKMTINQVESVIVKTAQARKEIQPLTLEKFINNCEKMGCTVIRYN